MKEIELAPPGAGLPRPEAFLIRKLIFPFLRFRLNKERSLKLFEDSGNAISLLITNLDEETFTQPTLIRRLSGLEDSSRNWSVELTLEHIQVVTASLIYIIKKLEANQPLDLPVRTEDVKPTGGLGLDRIRSFQTHLAKTPQKLSKIEFSSKATHHHPWFGDLESLDWLRLIAFHQDLHRKQIQLILAPPPC